MDKVAALLISKIAYIFTILFKFLCLIGLFNLSSVYAQESQSPVHSLYKQAPASPQIFSHNLTNFKRTLSQLKKQNDFSVQDIEKLLNQLQQLKAAHLLIISQFAQSKLRLDEAGKSGVYTYRLETTKNNYQEKIEPLIAYLERELNKPDASIRLGNIIQHAQTYLQQHNRNKQPAILGNNALPYRRIALQQRALNLDNIQPSYQNPDETATQPLAADLAATEETPLSEEIIAQAQALEYDYIRIYEFVRNNIKTEWYAGAMKGAVGTLKQGAGNDIDQASLLIALFRASGLSSRYIHGVIELPLQTIIDSLGLANQAQALQALNQSGIAFQPLIQGGQIQAVNIEHTWVTAYVPYTNYRGSVVDTSGSIWLPLAPAIKNNTATIGANNYSELQLSIDTVINNYLVQQQTTDIQSQLYKQLETYLQDNQIETTLDQEFTRIDLIEKTLGLLPNTLPYKVIAVNAETAELDNAKRHRVRFIARNGNNDTDNIIIDKTIALSQLNNERVTLSYIPATIEDQQTTNLFGGLDLVPAYLIRLRPQLKINGAVFAVATDDVETGIQHRLDIEITGPAGIQSIEKNFISGSYHALAFAAGDIKNELPCENYADASCNIEEDAADTEYLGAKLLSSLAYEYSQQWLNKENQIADLLNITVVRPLPSLVIASNDMRVDTILGQVSQISWQAVTLDAVMRIAQPVFRGEDSTQQQSTEKDFLSLATLQGSILEHKIFEQLFEVDSISADKALQIAAEQNINIVDLTAANFSTLQTNLTHPQNVLNHIENAVSQGYQVSTPVDVINYNAWQGHIWRIHDIQIGSGGYFIAGGLAGGSTTETTWAIEWLQDAISSANLPEPNNNSGQAALISKLSSSDYQKGTVGQPIDKPLAVNIRDINGLPVKGAEVTFRVLSGEGNFNNNDIIKVFSDRFGLASANLTLGQSTKINTIYTYKDISDKHISAASVNLATVSVASNIGEIKLEDPFNAIAFAGQPFRLDAQEPGTEGFEALEELGRLQFPLTPDFYYQRTLPGHLNTRTPVFVFDQYDNPVANVLVAASVQTESSACQNGSYAVGIYSSDEACFRGGDDNYVSCEKVNTTEGFTNSNGTVKFGIVSGSQSENYFVNYTSTGLGNIQHRLLGSRCDGYTTGNLNCFEKVVKAELDDEENIIAAGKAGTQHRGGISVELYWGNIRSGYQRIITNKPSIKQWLSFSDIDELQEEGLFPSDDFISTLSVEELEPLYDSALRRYNWVFNNITSLHESVFDLSETPKRKNIAITHGDTGAYYADLDHQIACQTNRAFVVGGAGHIYGLDLKIDTIESLSVPGHLDSTYIHIDGKTGRSKYPVEVKYEILPAEYISGSTEVLIYADNILVESVVADRKQSSGSVIISPQFVYDVLKHYQIELVVNRGTVNEVRSERTDLQLLFDIIADYDPIIKTSQDIDIPNNRTCSESDVIRFSLNKAARVTLDLYNDSAAIPGSDGIIPLPDINDSPTLTLIDDQFFQAGDHEVIVFASDVPPGSYHTIFKARAGQEEIRRGRALVELSFKNNLPVGHTIIKGVDVSDGNLSLGSTDIAIPGRGAALALNRSYSSSAGVVPGTLGIGWTHNYNSRVVINRCGEVIVIGGAGGGIRFVDDGNGGLRALRGYHATMIRNESDRSFDFYSKDGTQYHYQNYGRDAWDLAFIRDTNGNITKMAYEPGSSIAKLQSVQDSSGRRFSFEYENRNFLGVDENVDVIVAVNSSDKIQKAEFDYDNYGNLIAVNRVNASAQIQRNESYSYAVDLSLPISTRHKMLSYTDANGNTTQYQHQGKELILRDNAGNVIAQTTLSKAFVNTVTEPENGATSFAIDFDTKQSTVTDGRNLDNIYSLNQFGGVDQVRAPIGTTTRTWTEDDVLITSTTDANGVVTTFTYDVNGNLLTENVDGTHITNYTYYDQSAFSIPGIKNRLQSKTDRNGNITSYIYDAKGNLIQITDAEGGITRHSYNSTGDKVSTVDPNGNITNFRYDGFGNLTEVIDALGNKTSTEWSLRGLPTSITDALGRVTTNQYDNLGRLIQTTDALGNDKTFSYDAFGNKLTETDEAGRTTTFSYDGENRVTRIENAVGDAMTMSYDNNGNKTSETDWNGNITTFSYDDNDRLINQTEPEGRITTFTYDDVGNKLTETLFNPNGASQTTAFVYDELNRVIRITNAEGGIRRISYDGEGNKLSETDELGRVTTYNYDKLNRLISINEPEGRITQMAYDANSNKISETDANQRIRNMEYDALNRVIRERDAFGFALSKEYDAVGNIVSEIDANLNNTLYKYDVLNRRIETTDPLGFKSSFSYDPVGNLLQQTQPNANTITNSYDNLNRLLSSTDNLGSILTRQYDANGNITRETDANGNITINTYDGLDRLTQQQLPENRQLQMAYDIFNNKISETDPNNNTTTMAYDRLNRNIAITDPFSNSITMTYDAVGNKLTETDKRSNITTFTYDALNRITQTQDALNQTVSISYDPVGNKLTETDKRGNITTFTYDEENRLLTSNKNSVTLITNQYDPVGNKVLETDANGNKVAFVYDKRNQLITESRPLAAITRFTYDSMGNVLTQRDPEGRITTNTYDPRNRLLSQRNGENETESYSYDGNGNRISLTRPNNNSWQYAYDGADRLTTVTDALNNSTTFTYDNNSNRLTQTDANNNTTSYTYDALNRRISMTYADNSIATFSYDENGNRISMTDANGLSFSSTFDALNRETVKTYPLPSTPTGDDIQSITTQYDANNNITQIVEQYSGITGTRTTIQSYDTFDRLINKTDAQSEAITYSYDANGNRKTVKDSDDVITRYDYDELNRVSSVINSMGITNYQYDRSSLISRVNYPNGTQTRKVYDNANRITQIQNLQTSAVVSQYDYIYDDNGNRIEQIENNGANDTTTYSFDNNDRLTNFVIASGATQSSTTYTYDAAYNRLTEQTTENTGVTENKTYSYNNRNQVTSVTDNISAEQSDYTYDNNGNRLTKTVIASGTTQSLTTFTYDVRDQLTQILSGGSSIGQFLYDYQGLRIRKQTPTEILRYVYDDQSVLQQTDDAGTTLSKYDYGVDKLLSLNHTTEGAQFYLFDALGSVVNLTKPDGTIQTRIQYDAWGNVRNQVGSSANEFGFTGHEMDEESGLIYMKARFYDPVLGTFLNQDAFEGVVDTPPSLHKYLYAFSNSTVFVDLDGNQSTEIFETEGEAGERSFGDSASVTNSINFEPPEPRQSTAERIAELTRQTEIENRRRFENREQDRLEGIEEAKFRKEAWQVQENDSKPNIDLTNSSTPSSKVAARAKIISKGANDIADATDEFAVSQLDAKNIITTLAAIKGIQVVVKNAKEIKAAVKGVFGGKKGKPNTAIAAPLADSEAGTSAIIADKVINPGSATKNINASRLKDDLVRRSEKPLVNDPILAKQIDKLYRSRAKVGSGSTADAVRFELRTGQKVGGSFHKQKAEGSIVRLRKWLRDNPKANSKDKVAAENVIRDLENALNGK